MPHTTNGILTQSKYSVGNQQNLVSGTVNLKQQQKPQQQHRKDQNSLSKLNSTKEIKEETPTEPPAIISHSSV